MRTSTALILASSLALALAACGKRGDVYPPEDQEEAYTYPSTYPAPDTLVPGGGIERPEDEDAYKGQSRRGYRTTTTTTSSGAN